jgi:hypothetical protein
MALTALKKDITATGVNQEELYTFLANVVAAVNELQTQYAAALADLTALRGTVAATNTKLNADAGVTDTNYAAPAALTAVALAQLTLKLTP